ncbi:MAG: hypothetical protein V4760_07665 [Bdellovibrionota bacterium]
MSTQSVLKVVREAESTTEAEAASASIGRNEFGELFKVAKIEAAEAAAVSTAFRTAFAILAEVLVGSSKMVRRVGPNERPQERYEFENPETQNVRGPGSRVF